MRHPIGIQDIEQTVQDGSVYADKTQSVYRLVAKAIFKSVPMKRVFSFCLAALLAMAGLLLASCQSGKQGERLLQQADSLVKIRPDSMRTVLQAWADSMSREPEQVRMRYRLLCVKADDKAYPTA